MAKRQAADTPDPHEVLPEVTYAEAAAHIPHLADVLVVSVDPVADGSASIEIACRDGSLTYRQGIADGAPDAVQVSDRFQCAMRRLCAVRRGESKEVQDLLAGLSQQPGGS